RPVATNNVHYAEPDGFVGHDVLRCVAALCPLDQPHPGRPLNAERHLKSAREMADLYRWRPDALENTVRIAETCEAALPEREEMTPFFPVPDGHDAASYLRHLTYKGAKVRYRPLSERVVQRIEHELDVITQLGYADYFLMVWDIVRWARRNGIRCTGRGSAADSCVACCLTLTDVDVISRRLPFARFLTPGKTPDIDIDFPSERRDDVFRHIVAKYGDEHVGMVCTFHTFWAKSAVRDVGKALGLPQDALTFFSDHVQHNVRADRLDQAFERYAELRPHAALRDRFQLLFDLCGRIAGFPRHIGTHSSGVVISRAPLSTVAPLQPSARGVMRIWTLDKDDAEAAGAIKFDVLSLRILSAVGDAERDIVRLQSEAPVDASGSGASRVASPAFVYDRIPFGDPLTFRMFRAGAAVGAFQFESAAQIALAATLQPEHFEDLVASVALIRPGPIRGNVVQRFVACRNGWLRADLLHPALEPMLAKTYGCIVYQEQVNDVVAAMTGWSDAEADRFRKRLTRRSKLGEMDMARAEFVSAAAARRPDLGEENANRLFDQIEGWAGYGFTEGHAASFALTGYRSAYLSVHHAAAYFSGLMNHQPMGYYSANTLAGEARHRGVRILPVEINQSEDKCFASEPDAIRLGLRVVADLRDADIEAIVEARREREYRSLLDFCGRVLLHRHRLENLVLCGAFDLLHEHRRGILWRLDETSALARSYRAEAGATGQLPGACPRLEGMLTPTAWELDDFTAWDKFLWAWRITGVCAECHVFTYLRDLLNRWRVWTTDEAQRAHHGQRITVAGLNVRPHRPPTRSGEPVIFTILEDEMGTLQATIAGPAIDACTAVFLTSPAVLVRGRIVRKGQGVSLQVERAKPLRMADLAQASHEVHTEIWDRRWKVGANVRTEMRDRAPIGAVR
ncbi:MAG TPA: DNA polymerase III subunit alpha, partial [Chthonomonadales bacterium]|nr:DNA polymerase III subunit alpha [Chthonomonadales bacterium]